MSKKPEPGLDAALQEGWASACQLYEHLAGGGEPVALPPSALRLNHDEVPYADAVVGYARFYGMNVTYQQSNSFWWGSAAFVAAGMAADAIGNSAAKRRAEAMAATQWRDHAHVHAVLTDKRILADYQGNWLNFWHEGVVEFQGDLGQWLIVLRYQVGDPLMMHGPAVPWFAVLIARLVYGPRGLQLPVLAPIAHSVAQRRQMISGEVVPGDSGPPALPAG